MKENGKLIISLDFELLWGMREHATIESYGQNILGVWDTFPEMLKLFEEYKIRATFGCVGFLFAKSKSDLKTFSPKNEPNYFDKRLSPYNGYFDTIGNSEDDDKFHFAPSLIDLIQQYPEQEIATHTFSHYYCLERSQSIDAFTDDLNSAVKIAISRGVELKSIVFPRNQYNDACLEACQTLGISSFRGNEKSWYNKPSSNEDDNIARKVFRVIDTYFNISGNNTYSMSQIAKKPIYDIASSRFLRAYNPKFRILESLRIKRILNAMTFAAKNDQIYHLWWHPHNFGKYSKENFEVLIKILTHYKLLNEKYGFESMSMTDLCEELDNKQ